MDAKDPVIPRGGQGSGGNQGHAFFPQRGIPTTIPHTAVSHVSPQVLHALESQYGKKGTANAQYKDGVITIALNAQDPIGTAFTHELVHGIRAVSPEAYASLKRFVIGNMSKAPFSANFLERAQRYGSADMDAMTEETVADACGRLLGNKEALHKKDALDKTGADISIPTELATVNSQAENFSLKDTASQVTPDDAHKVRGSLEGGGTSLSEIAKSWQGTDRYPGVDRYRDITLKKGKVIYRGEPYGSEYFTTLSAIKRSGNDATKIFEGLQVEKHKKFGYKSEMQSYLVTSDIDAAFGITKANTQYGAGGLPQVFVPDVEELIKKGVLVPVDKIDLVNFK